MNFDQRQLRVQNRQKFQLLIIVNFPIFWHSAVEAFALANPAAQGSNLGPPKMFHPKVQSITMRSLHWPQHCNVAPAGNEYFLCLQRVKVNFNTGIRTHNHLSVGHHCHGRSHLKLFCEMRSNIKGLLNQTYCRRKSDVLILSTNLSCFNDIFAIFLNYA